MRGSYSAAIRSLWFAYDDVCALGSTPPVVNVADHDNLVTEALARKHAVGRRRLDDA